MMKIRIDCYMVHSMHYVVLKLWERQQMLNLQSVNSFYYLAPTCFCIVTILRELTPIFH